MTWIYLSIPFMILAVLVAVLPVPVMPLRESRRIASEAAEPSRSQGRLTEEPQHGYEDALVA